jgi:hypothetical protein
MVSTCSRPAVATCKYDTHPLTAVQTRSQFVYECMLLAEAKPA